MGSCDRRVKAYKNGKTFDQCRDIAEDMNPDFKKQIDEKSKIFEFSNQHKLRVVGLMSKSSFV